MEHKKNVRIKVLLPSLFSVDVVTFSNRDKLYSYLKYHMLSYYIVIPETGKCLRMYNSEKIKKEDAKPLLHAMYNRYLRAKKLGKI